MTGGLAADFSAIAEDLRRGMLPPRVFNDQEIYQRELERIFAKCWVFVGHESEIPSPGDYVLRYVGEDQFILARDENGELQLLLNNCAHRGSQVCRAEKGNTSHFRCPYHGWIYKNTGEWNGAPFRARAYKKLDTKQWGLRKAANVDTYQGLVFACLDPQAVSLREYLGDMCWYLDILLGLNEGGMRVEGDPHRWRVAADWKSGAENFAGDAYHVPHLHRSVEEIGIVPNIDSLVESPFHVMLEGGHNMIVHRGTLPPPWGYLGFPPDVVETFDLSRLDDSQRLFLEKGHGVTVFTIFPNLSFIQAPSVFDPTTGQPPVIFTALRQWQPRGPGRIEIWNWPLVWNSAPAEFNDLSYRASLTTFGPSGLLEQDDTVAWTGAPVAGGSVFARQDGMKLNYQLGLDGMSDYSVVDDWIGPGTASSSVFGEAAQRGFWTRWMKEVSGE